MQSNTDNNNNSDSNNNLIFINYVPSSTSLKLHLQQPNPSLVELTNIEHEVDNFIDSILIQGNKSSNIPMIAAPKRANIDLKQDCEAKFKKLDRLTNKAIQRLAESLQTTSEKN
jgi:hypothetical protein